MENSSIKVKITPEASTLHIAFGNESFDHAIRVNKSGITYGSLVSAIIAIKYSGDEMTAIINNHLLEANEEHEQEFAAMQAWRTTAKAAAKEIITALQSV